MYAVKIGCTYRKGSATDTKSLRRMEQWRILTIIALTRNSFAPSRWRESRMSACVLWGLSNALKTARRIRKTSKPILRKVVSKNHLQGILIHTRTPRSQGNIDCILKIAHDSSARMKETEALRTVKTSISMRAARLKKRWERRSIFWNARWTFIAVIMTRVVDAVMNAPNPTHKMMVIFFRLSQEWYMRKMMKTI